MIRQILTAAALSLALAACATAPSVAPQQTPQSADAELRFYTLGVMDHMIANGTCVMRPEFRNIARGKIADAVVSRAGNISAQYERKHGRVSDSDIGTLFQAAVMVVLKRNVCKATGRRT